MKLSIIFFTVFYFIAVNFSFSQWEWQSPIPQGNLLYKVYFLNSSEGWTSGAYGTILHTTDGGLNWIQQEYGRTDDILDIKMISNLKGWAVGDNGMIIHTTNGGSDWIEQVSGTTEGLNSLFFIDSLNGWAVGDKEIILHTSNGGITWEFQQNFGTQYSINSVTFINSTTGWAAGANRRVYHTTDGGTSWITQMIGSSMTAHLNIYFADGSLGFIVGTGGSIMRTTDGGTSWSQISTGEVINYNQIIMQNTLVGWIAGDGGRILRTLNGGASWSTTILAEGFDLNGITRYSGTGTLWMVGEYGKILRSTNNGVSWASLDSGSRLSVNWIDFSSATTGMAVGQTGLILRTTDGGISWTEITSPVPSISLFGIDMIDDKNAWAVGDEATILHTSDGYSWSLQPNPATNYILFGVKFINSQNGWIVGGDLTANTGIILYTTNSGGNWNIQLNTSFVVFGINFTDNQNGWAVGSGGTILHTTNGGSNWITQTSTVTTTLYWCSFSDPLNGWAVGDEGTILRTTNGGTSWIKQNSGVISNLYSIETDGDLFAIAIGDQGTILRTTDGGTVWQKEYSRTKIDLFGIAHCINTWVCGDYGTILRYLTPTTYGTVTGRIINDINNNGFPDIGEPGIAGWKIRLEGPETRTTYSTTDGSFIFSEVATGLYTLTQEVLPGWIQTMPVSPESYLFTITSSATTFNGNFCNYAPVSVPFEVQDGWNLLSFPIVIDDPRISSVFPSAQSGAYYYTDMYTTADSLKSKYGFWMKFPESAIHWINGTFIQNDTVPVRAGWNIIGSVGDTVDTSAVISEPPNIIISNYYGYDRSYIISNSIKPGKGYWVKVAQNGRIILNSGEKISSISKKSDQAIMNKLNSLTITDARERNCTLYFSSDKTLLSEQQRFELPPLPPEECFDIRFQNGATLHLFEETSGDRILINLQAVQVPLRISWDIRESDQSEYRLINLTGKNEVVSLPQGTGSVILASAKSPLLSLTSSRNEKPSTTPTEFTLMQNSPNPFNPVTTIKFTLPAKSHVRLEIFSTLGQMIETLIDDVRDQGTYSILWSPKIAGGIYFYRLSAKSTDESGRYYISTKKMVLLK